MHSACILRMGVNNKSKVKLESRDDAPRASLYRIRVPLRSHHHMRPRSLAPLPVSLPLPVPLPAPLALEASAASAAASTLLRSFSARVGSTAVLLLALAAPLRATCARLGGGPVITVFVCVLSLGGWHLEDIQQLVLFHSALVLGTGDLEF